MGFFYFALKVLHLILQFVLYINLYNLTIFDESEKSYQAFILERLLDL